jgi:CheY-like chemotaxis protein
MTMGMAHDFNNLLAGIMGHLELWSATAEEHGPELEHIRTIERAARDGADLIGRVQRYIRQERRSDYQPIDLTALVTDCITFTRPYWYNEPRRQGISIEVERRLDELPAVNGSPAEIRDVFVNLILNAVHAMPEGGTITVAGRAEGDDVFLEFSDTGTGMTAQVAERIFEPLFTTKGERGTGMGLAVAAGVMREHGGSISVDSELGRGTTFTLSFPAAARERVEQPVRQRRPASESDLTVLVVDDEPMVRNVVDRLLSLAGHTVISAESGPAALDEMRNRRFDVVITDQGMPEMSGRELAHHLHEEYPETPVILLTGDTDLSVDDAEIRRVLAKPFRAEDLADAIRSVA